MKKLLLTILIINTCISYAQVNDYSTGNTNPFKKYYYHLNSTKQILHKTKNDKHVYTANIQNNTPLNINFVLKEKYKNLIDNSKYINGCWDRAGKIYGVDPWLLMAVAKVESNFNRNAININKNKSVDIGMMQINTIWLPTLNKYGITKQDLLHPCTSIFVGAWIMAQNLRKFGYNYDGIGAYNSPKNIKIRRNYAKKVHKAYHEITNDLYYRRKM